LLNVDRDGPGLIGQIKLTVELNDKLLSGFLGRFPAAAIQGCCAYLVSLVFESKADLTQSK